MATERSADWHIDIGPSGSEVVKVQGRIDAADSLEVELHGFEVPEDTKILIYLKPNANNQNIFANLIIYEEENK